MIKRYRRPRPRFNVGRAGSSAARSGTRSSARNALNATQDISEKAATGGKEIQKGFIKTAQAFAEQIDDSAAGRWVDNKTGLSSMGKELYKQSKKQGGPGITKGFGDAAEKTGYVSRKTVDGKKVIEDVNVGKIAGAYVGLSAGARVISGGGLYKDNQGNTNIAGIPFV